MYEVQTALSRVHLKYSQTALLNLFHIFEAFKLSKVVRDNARIVKRGNDRALIEIAEEAFLRQVKHITQWAQLKEKQLLFSDFYFSVKFKGVKVKLTDQISSCELSLPKGEVVAAKDERLAMFKIWGMQITTYAVSYTHLTLPTNREV